MNHHQPLPQDLANARLLLSIPQGRTNKEIFLTLAKAFHSERELRGYAPKFRIKALGRALGLEDLEISGLDSRARLHAEAQRRVAIHHHPQLGHRHAPVRWVLDGKIILKQ